MVKCAYCERKIPEGAKIYKHRADIICPTEEEKQRIFCSEFCAESYFDLLARAGANSTRKN